MKSIKAIEAELTTPYVIYDLDNIRDKYQNLKQFLKNNYPNNQIFYALKSCYYAPIVKALVDEGCGLEIVSEDEYQIVEQLQLKQNKFIWNGAALAPSVLREIVSKHQYVNVDSESLYQQLLHHSLIKQQKLSVGLRVNLTGHGKFGLAADQIEKLLQQPEAIQINGFHIHLDSKVSFVEGLKLKNQFLQQIILWEEKYSLNIDYIDLGGGIDQDQTLDEYFLGLIELIKRLKSKPSLFIEPGAWLVDTSASVFSRVNAKKQINGQKWAFLDIGANFMVPLDRSDFKVINHQSSNTEEHYHFSGNIPLENDVIEFNVPHSPELGEIIEIRQCGAYTESLSSYFANSPPRKYWREKGVLYTNQNSLNEKALFMLHHGYGLKV